MKSYFTLSGCLSPQFPCSPEIGFLVAFWDIFQNTVSQFLRVRTCMASSECDCVQSMSREVVIKTKLEISEKENRLGQIRTPGAGMKAASATGYAIAMWTAHQDE